MSDSHPEIAAAAQAYYAQTSDFPLTATDFYDWLASLPTARQAHLLATGFRTSQAEPDFLRWCLEQRGYAMRPFMADRLSVAAYAIWAAHQQLNGDLPVPALAR